MKLISVIIPYYNNAHTIERALNSVRLQTYKYFEVIIVNDCSPDWKEAELIVEKFVDLNIKVVHHSQNKNGSVARNTGIKAARGEFIALLDADDEWYPGHLEKSFSHYNFLNKDLVLIYCQNLMKTGIYKDIIMPMVAIKRNQRISNYLFIDSGFISTPSMFAPAKIFKDVLFDETLIRHQDYKFLLDLDKNKIPVSMSNHLGVIVHWEYNDIEKKGGTWKFSLDWAINNKVLFTNKSFKYFIINNSVFPLFQKKQRTKGLIIFLRHAIDLYSIKFSYKIISMFLFGRIIFAKI